MALAPLGTFNYNGYTFSEKVETRDFSAVPIYDSADRTVVYTRFSLTVREIILGDPTDVAVVLARRLLNKPGGALVIQDRGVGVFNVNVGNQRDVAWGPKPKEVAFRYLGRDRACELIWKVEFALPDCSAAVYQFAPLEFCYAVDYDIDRSGLTKRTLTGHLRIPMTRRRQGDRQLPDCVDEYREQIDPPHIRGFRRIPGKFTISEDKTRLNFTFVDEQLPGPAPPPGVIEVHASHSLTSASAALATWVGTIDATYEMEFGRDKSLAIGYFIQFAIDRMEADRKSAGNESFGTVVLHNFSMREPEVYGKSHAAFSITYTFSIAGGRLDKFLAENGLWTKVPNSDPDAWDASIALATSPRGSANLRLVPGDDSIIDLCINDDVPTPPSPSKITDLRSAQQQLRLAFPPPKRDKSWVHWECHVEIQNDAGVVELRTLPIKTLTPEPPRSPGAQSGIPTGTQSTGSRLINDYIPLANQTSDPPQRRDDPSIVVYLVGKALRAGFPIPEPTLAPIAGIKPVAANRRDWNPAEKFSHGVVGNVGVPLYAAKWRLRFLLDKIPPVGIEALTPKNPLQGQ